MNLQNKPKITLFHCLNSFEESSSTFDGCDAKTVTMPCSSMTKDVHLLRAFEAGADAVIVMVCPEKGCRYSQGSRRAKKRVNYIKNLLDEIGMDGKRLSFHNVKASNKNATNDIIKSTLLTLEELGPNPAITRLN